MPIDELKDSKHPWGKFLYARFEAMLWMREEMGYRNAEIADKMCMDENQVRLILMNANEK